MSQSGPDDRNMHDAEAQIEWVIAHPRMSTWLKEALRTACEQDSVQVLNDLEILRTLLSRKADATFSRHCDLRNKNPRVP